jgi:hypothetical protein
MRGSGWLNAMAPPHADFPIGELSMTSIKLQAGHERRRFWLPAEACLSRQYRSLVEATIIPACKPLTNAAHMAEKQARFSRIITPACKPLINSEETESAFRPFCADLRIILHAGGI